LSGIRLSFEAGYLYNLVMGRTRNEKNPASLSYGSKIGRPAGTTGIKRKEKENKKVKCHFSISPEANDMLNHLSEKTGDNKSVLVEKAVLNYFNGQIIP